MVVTSEPHIVCTRATTFNRASTRQSARTWVTKRDGFEYILCDVNRWDRFQGIDFSAQFSAICKKHGKQVIYTTIGKPQKDDPLYPVQLSDPRWLADAIQ